MVEYLEIGEKSIPVRINRKAIVLFEKKFNKGLASLGSMGTEELSFLLYLGVVEGFKFTGEPNTYKKFEHFEDELDSVPVGEFYEKAGKVIASFFSVKK